MFEFLDEPIPITSQQWREGTIPQVSISCITYNHENYIRNAIEGFLMQKTTFPVEILIHDDASTDKTAEIVREYEKKYPQLIKPIYQTENQYSKGIGVSTTFQFPRALGKYIALCEGDDYWIDPLKMQKQVDFLEANPEYVICAHRTKVLKDGDLVEDTYLRRVPSVTTKYHMARGNYIRTLSVVCHNILDKHIITFPETCLGDHFLWLFLTYHRGKIKILQDVMGVYRMHDGGIWTGAAKEDKLQNLISHYEMLTSYFSEKKLKRKLNGMFVYICYMNSISLLRKLKIRKSLYYFKYSFRFKFNYMHLFFPIEKVIRNYLNR